MGFLLTPRSRRTKPWVVMPSKSGRAATEMALEVHPPQRAAAPSPSFQPPGGTLVNLPTIFDAGSGPASPAGFDLAGLHITVTPKPLRWTWTFEPGVTQAATLPGGTYPNKDVTYTYRTTGPRAVTVTARGPVVR